MKPQLRSVAILVLVTAVLAGSAVTVASNGSAVGPNPNNGHYYERVMDPGLDWNAAKAAADTRYLNGCQGYLATITSADESSYMGVQGLFDITEVWLGGYQTGPGAPDANWNWVTGEPWSYTNWHIFEPNDSPWGPYEANSEQWLEVKWGDGTWNDTLLFGAGQAGYLIEYIAGACPQIDIKPGSDPNCFNNNGHGVIPVAILTSDTFDAATVDPFTVELDGASAREKGKSGKAGSLEDVDSDGDLDLVVQIEDVDGTYAAGDTVATLTGFTYDGTSIWAQDSVCIVP